MIEICNDNTTKLTPLEYILNNDVKIDIRFNDDFYLNKDNKKDFDNKIDNIINYLNYYGIDYDEGLSSTDIEAESEFESFYFNTMFFGAVGTTTKLNITKDALEILDKDQMINLLNSIFNLSYMDKKIQISIYQKKGENERW